MRKNTGKKNPDRIVNATRRVIKPTPAEIAKNLKRKAADIQEQIIKLGDSKRTPLKLKRIEKLKEHQRTLLKSAKRIGG